MAEIPRLTILTGRLPVDVAKNLKSHGWANSELAIPKDLPGCGEIQEKSPIQSGDFRHPPIYIERATYLGFRQNPKIIRVGKYRIRPSERPPVFWRYRRGGRNSQEDQTEDATARGFRQNHKSAGAPGGVSNWTPGGHFGFWRNPRSVAHPVWKFQPRRKYCRRGRNPQTDQTGWWASREFRRNPKIHRAGEF